MEHKRRAGTKNRSASGKLGTALLIVLSLVIIAGVIVFSPAGEYLLTNVIKPIFASSGDSNRDEKIVSALKAQDEKIQPSASPKPTEKAHETLLIEETPFYILQMGAFLNKNDAEDHAAEIRRMGAGGEICSDGTVYRVFAAAYLDEESLMKVQSQVRADGFEATPYITESKAIRIQFDGDAEAVSSLKNAITLLHDIPVQLSEICLQFDKGELDPKKVFQSLNDILKTCNESVSAIQRISDQSAVSIRELLAKYQENISTFLQEHDTMDTESLSSELKRLQIRVIEDYILFFDRK